MSWRSKARPRNKFCLKGNFGDAGPVGEYLRVAAQVRCNQELVAALKQASDDSGKLQFWLLLRTLAIFLAGVAQAIATWFHH